MSTKSRKQTIGHAQVDTSINAPGLVAAARNTQFRTPVSVPDMAGVEGQRRIAAAAKSFVPTLRGMAARKSAKDNEEQAMLGSADRKMAGEQTMDDYYSGKDIVPTQARVIGWETTNGRANGHDAGMEWTEIVANSSSEIHTAEQFEKLESEFLAAKLKGNDNPHEIKAFLSAFGPSEKASKEDWNADKVLAVKSEALTQTNTVIRGELAGLGEGTATPAQYFAVERGMRALAKTQGIGNVEFNDMYLDNAVMHAIAYPESQIFGDPEDMTTFGVFEMSGKDVNDPSKMQPAMANSPEYQKKLFQAKSQVIRARESDKEAADQEVIFLNGKRINALQREGKLVESEALIKKGVKEGWWSGISGIAQSEENDAIHRQMVIDHEDEVMMMAGKLRYGTSDKDKVATSDRIYKKRIMAANGDPEKIVLAQHQQREMNATTGSMDTVSLETMINAQPNQGGQGEYHVAVREFNLNMEQNPTSTAKHVGPDKVKEFTMYNQAIAAGMTPDRAEMHVFNNNTVERRAAVKEILAGPKRYEIEDHIKAHLVRNGHKGGWFNSNVDIVNEGMIEREYMNLTVQYYANGEDMEGAVAYADAVIASRFRTVMSPNGTARYVAMSGASLHADFEEAEKDFSNDPALRQKLGLKEGEYLFLQNDVVNPNSGNYIVYKGGADGQMMEPVMRSQLDGVGRGNWRMSADDMVTDYHIKTADKPQTTEEVQAEHAVNMTEAQRKEHGAEKTQEAFEDTGIPNAFRDTVDAIGDTVKSIGGVISDAAKPAAQLISGKDDPFRGN